MTMSIYSPTFLLFFFPEKCFFQSILSIMHILRKKNHIKIFSETSAAMFCLKTRWVITGSLWASSSSNFSKMSCLKLQSFYSLFFCIYQFKIFYSINFGDRHYPPYTHTCYLVFPQWIFFKKNLDTQHFQYFSSLPVLRYLQMVHLFKNWTISWIFYATLF